MTTMGRDGTVEQQTSPWPRYDAAETGLRNYWYPVTWSSRVGKKPLAFRLLDEPIFLLRSFGVSLPPNGGVCANVGIGKQLISLDSRRFVPFNLAGAVVLPPQPSCGANGSIVREMGVS